MFFSESLSGSGSFFRCRPSPVSRKFGIDAKDEERILRQRDPDKLDDALEAVLFAASREEVLRLLK